MLTSMTTDQIDLVQRSFGRVLPVADVAASQFYDRLFTLDPRLRPLFADDLSEQKRALMAMLQTVVNGLDRPDALLPAVRQLGASHARYGVAERDYDTVGAALLWTLQEALGAAFTPATRDAWRAAYDLLASTMKRGARVPDQLECTGR